MIIWFDLFVQVEYWVVGGVLEVIQIGVVVGVVRNGVELMG